AAGSLNRLNSCVTNNHSGVTSPPALVKPGTQELALYSRSDGTMAQVAIDTPTTPATCGTEVVTPFLNAGNTSPVVTVNGAGQTIAIIGGARPDTLTTWLVNADGTLTELNSYAPVGYDVLRDIPMAIDHDTVYTAPRFRMQASAFQYTDGFNAAP